MQLNITDVRVVPGDSGFLIDTGKTTLLYDSGFAFTGEALADNIQKILGDRPLDYILLSHSHYDHVLGAPYVARRYPGAKIIAGAYAHRIFQKPTARATMRQLNEKAAQAQGITDFEDLIDDLRVDIPVEDGDRLQLGDLELSVIALPGHTKCSVGYYLPRYKLLLGTETLGVYFGKETYLPSFLVGYRMALDSFQRAGQLDMEQILLPHYGMVEREELATYLKNSEAVTRNSAQRILSMLCAGLDEDEILERLSETDYLPHVRPVYPPDAYRLNTRIMIRQVQKELLPDLQSP